MAMAAVDKQAQVGVDASKTGSPLSFEQVIKLHRNTFGIGSPILGDEWESSNGHGALPPSSARSSVSSRRRELQYHGRGSMSLSSSSFSSSNDGSGSSSQVSPPIPTASVTVSSGLASPLSIAPKPRSPLVPLRENPLWIPSKLFMSPSASSATPNDAGIVQNRKSADGTRRRLRLASAPGPSSSTLFCHSPSIWASFGNPSTSDSIGTSDRPSARNTASPALAHSLLLVPSVRSSPIMECLSKGSLCNAMLEEERRTFAGPRRKRIRSSVSAGGVSARSDAGRPPEAKGSQCRDSGQGHQMDSRTSAKPLFTPLPSSSFVRSRKVRASRSQPLAAYNSPQTISPKPPYNSNRNSASTQGSLRSLSSSHSLSVTGRSSEGGASITSRDLLFSSIHNAHSARRDGIQSYHEGVGLLEQLAPVQVAPKPTSTEVTDGMRANDRGARPKPPAGPFASTNDNLLMKASTAPSPSLPFVSDTARNSAASASASLVASPALSAEAWPQKPPYNTTQLLAAMGLSLEIVPGDTSEGDQEKEGLPNAPLRAGILDSTAKSSMSTASHGMSPALESVSDSVSSVTSPRSLPRALRSSLPARSSPKVTPSTATFAEAVERSNSHRCRAPPCHVVVTPACVARLRRNGGRSIISASTRNSAGPNAIHSTVPHSDPMSSVETFFPAHERPLADEAEAEAVEDVDDASAWRGVTVPIVAGTFARRSLEASVSNSELQYFTPPASVESHSSLSNSLAFSILTKVQQRIGASRQTWKASSVAARPAQAVRSILDQEQTEVQLSQVSSAGDSRTESGYWSGDAASRAYELSRCRFLDKSEDELMAMERQQRHAGMADACARLEGATARSNKPESARNSMSSNSGYTYDIASAAGMRYSMSKTEAEVTTLFTVLAPDDPVGVRRPSLNSSLPQDSDWSDAISWAASDQTHVLSDSTDTTPPVSSVQPRVRSAHRKLINGSSSDELDKRRERDSWASLLSFTAEQDVTALAATTSELPSAVRATVVKGVMEDAIMPKQRWVYPHQQFAQSASPSRPISLRHSLPEAWRLETPEQERTSRVKSPEGSKQVSGVSPEKALHNETLPQHSAHANSSTIPASRITSTAVSTPTPVSMDTRAVDTLASLSPRMTPLPPGTLGSSGPVVTSVKDAVAADAGDVADPSKQADRMSNHWSDTCGIEDRDSRTLKRGLSLKRSNAWKSLRGPTAQRNRLLSTKASDAKSIFAAFPNNFPSSLTILGRDPASVSQPLSPLLIASTSSAVHQRQDLRQSSPGSQPVPAHPRILAISFQSKEEQQHHHERAELHSMSPKEPVNPTAARTLAVCPDAPQHNPWSLPTSTSLPSTATAASEAEKRISLLASLGSAVSDSTPKLSSRPLPAVREYPQIEQANGDAQEIALARLLDALAPSSWTDLDWSTHAPNLQQASGSQEMVHRSKVYGKDNSDNSSDNYGSSDGGGNQSSNVICRGGAHANDVGEDPRQPGTGRPALDETVSEDFSSQSEDDYGGVDELDAGRRGAVLSQQNMLRADSSEDDIPLGKRVDNPDRLQEKLNYRVQKEQSRRGLQTTSSTATRSQNSKEGRVRQKPMTAADLKTGLSISGHAASNGSIDPSDLSSRLRRVQSARQPNAKATHHSESIQPEAAIVPLKPLSRQRPLSRRHASTNNSRQGDSMAVQHKLTAPSELGKKAAELTLSRSSTRARDPSVPPLPPVPRHLAQVIGSPDSLLSESAHAAPTPVSPTIPAAPMHHQTLAAITAAASSASPGPVHHTRTGSPVASASAFQGGSKQDTIVMTSLIQHKVYLITKQRYVNVNVRSDARARDLVLEAMNNGSVANDDSTLGGWVIFDVSAEFGIERPIREYELVSEVAEHRASQSHDYFLLRRTELAPYVSLRSVPDRSPALAGYVYVQDRKKKWSKRWLELRDHSLFHAKSDSGKDEEHICTLSNFDVYLVTNPRFKGPKAHSFAIRSQDKITMFEKPDQDYLHFFCLSDPAAHRDWVKNILNARTYILRQERATLFRVLTAATVAQTFIGADSAHPGVRRSGSLKHAVTTTTPRPDQTLSSAAVSVSSEGVAEPISALHASSKPLLLNADLLSGPFEKGSLLAEVATRGLMSNSTTRRPAEGDFSMHERTRQRLEESARKAERQQALAAAIAEGRPLLHLSPRQ